jgi:rubrerythrin
MTVDIGSLSLEQSLNMALKAEKESETLYSNLRKMVKNFVMKDKLQFLISEEKKHQKVIKALFERLFPGKKPNPKIKSLAPKISLALKEENSVIDLLELAMETEKMFEEFYDTLSQEVEERGVHEILQYLASMEHGHYSLIKGEYDLCVRDEEYFNRGEFQYDMVHIGP